jgi:hypothetical protein
MEERTDHDSVDGPDEGGRPAREDLDRIVPEVTPSGTDSAPAESGEAAEPAAVGGDAVETPEGLSADSEPETAEVEHAEPDAPESDIAAAAVTPVEAEEGSGGDDTPVETAEPPDGGAESTDEADDAPAKEDGTLDEIAVAETPEDEEVLPRPDSAEAAPGDDTPGAPVAKARVPWWPFLIYLVAWIALIGAAFYLISYEPDSPPAFQQDEYPYILLGGLVLTVVGPLLSLVVWFVAWLRTEKGKRGGLLTSALLKGAIVTIFGVLAWWGTIVLLDALILGLIGPIS